MKDGQSNHKTILITGATAGIGYEFVKLYSGKNYHVIAVGRNQLKLTELKNKVEGEGHSIATFLVDLSKPEDVIRFSNNLQSNNTHIDILINNAGSGVYNEFVKTDLKREIEMLNTNILSTTILTKAVLQQMIRHGSGKIMNIASTAAFKPGPLMSVYYASKSYILSFSKALSQELKGTGITVTVLCPGKTRTEFLRKAFDRNIPESDLKKMQDPAKIALSGYQALEKNRTMVVPGLMNKINLYIVKLVPEKVILSIIHYLKKKKLTAV